MFVKENPDRKKKKKKKTHTNALIENPFRQKKKSVECEGTYLEPTSRFHGCFMTVVLKRISFPISIFLSFCLLQGPKSCLRISILTAGYL